MRAWPDAPAVEAALARAWRRLMIVAALDGAAIGLALAAASLVIGWVARWPPGVSASVAVLLVLLPTIRGGVMAIGAKAMTAARFEARVPECRNVVVTAAEILGRRQPLRDDIGARICRDATGHLARRDIGAVFPLGRSLFRLGGAAVLATLVATLTTHQARATLAGLVNIGAPAISRVVVVVTPPEYSGRAAETLRDPTSLSVLAGSRIALDVAATAPALTLETVSGSQALARDAAGTFAGVVTAEADGFLTFVPLTGEGASGSRRLIGLTVVPDRAPVVRVTAPGHDLLVDSGNRHLDVTMTAADDLALDSLRLVYTKVSGSGENFEFARGEVPVTLVRTDAREWKASARWALGALELEPGDMVVYRALAADRRPGGQPVESDAFIVEVAAPGSVAAEGFAVDDQTERYAISQRMVIVKTERLIARRASMSAEDFADEARGLAAEQRSVRAEFIFMMGGELEAAGIDASEDLNEEAEAHGEEDLLAGRARNQGRLDLLAATRRMSEAATLLNVPEMPTALVAERAALVALQRAFSKSRYLLRALSARERLDMTRRLTGSIAEASADRRPAETTPPDPRLATLRRSLSTLMGLSGLHTYSRDEAAVATTVADALLRVDPASVELRETAADLSAAAAAMSANAPASVATSLDKALTRLGTTIRATMPVLPGAPGNERLHRLTGAVADAQSRRGGR